MPKSIRELVEEAGKRNRIRQEVRKAGTLFVMVVSRKASQNVSEHEARK